MGRLHNAYSALGLEAGAPIAMVVRRYKWLAHVFHPDRFGEEKRPSAEREMKRINEAREILRAHFALKHPGSGERCECETTNTSVLPKSCAEKRSSSATFSQMKSARRQSSTVNQSASQSETKSALANYPDALQQDSVKAKQKRTANNTEQSNVTSARNATCDDAHCAESHDTQINIGGKSLVQLVASIPQWLLFTVAAVCLSLAMCLNHANTPSVLYNTGSTQQQ